MNRVFAGLVAILHTSRVQMTLSMARPMFQFIILLQPFVMTTIAYLVYGSTSPLRLVNYVVLGAGFTTLWSSIVFSSASDINRERYYGTLETIFVAPVSFAAVLAGKIIGNTVLGIASMGLSTLYLVGVYRVKIALVHPLWLLGAFLIAFLALSSFSFFLAMVFTLSRQAEMWMNSAEYPLYVLCGFLFPITSLPSWVHPISYALPPTWIIQLVRDSLSATISNGERLTTLFTVLGCTGLYSIAAYFCYRYFEYKARDIGKLGVY